MSRIDGDLRKLFRAHLKQADWQTIETNGLGGSGVPDANFCFPVHEQGVEGWIEYKATHGYDVRLRPEQIGWLSRRARRGGRVFVAVRRRPKLGGDELWLLKGSAAPDIRVNGLMGAAQCSYLVGCWVGGPARWDWDQVAQGLTMPGLPLPLALPPGA